MSCVLVTGGAGFIGSHVCEALLARGDRVVALDNFDDFYDASIKRRNLTASAKHATFTLIEGDIRDADAVGATIVAHGVDTIVHLAARAGVRPSIENPLLYQDVNVRGTNVLLEAARAHRVGRFVMASSSSVYGNNDKAPFSEDDRVDHPISPYAATKKACELIAHSYCHLFDMNVTCLRLFTAYGPRQRPDLAIHKFARLIEAGRPIPVFGDGSTSRDYTYVADIVDGVLRAVDRCSGYRLYNLGESRPVSLSDLIKSIERALGRSAVVDRRPMQPGDVNRTYADIGRATAELGYDPKTDIDTGLAHFVTWLRGEGAGM
jgi:UDP-glucuronate 4-epimerase